MTIILIAYDVLAPLINHQPYSLTTVFVFPFQVLIAFAAIALYSRHRVKRNEQEKAKKAAAQRREQLTAEQTAAQHAQNMKRNKAVDQRPRVVTKGEKNG